MNRRQRRERRLKMPEGSPLFASLPSVKNSRALQSGTVKRTVTDTTLPTGPVERELERTGQHPAAEIDDLGHRRVLPNIDRDRNAHGQACSRHSYWQCMEVEAWQRHQAFACQVECDFILQAQEFCTNRLLS